MQRVKDINLIEKYIRLNKIENLFNDEIRKNSEILFFNKRELIFQEGEEIKYLMFFVRRKGKSLYNIKKWETIVIRFL